MLTRRLAQERMGVFSNAASSRRFCGRAWGRSSKRPLCIIALAVVRAHAGLQVSGCVCVCHVKWRFVIETRVFVCVCPCDRCAYMG